MTFIYEPKGRAKEYAELACNYYRGCAHGCLYCYAPQVLKMKREDFARARPRDNALEQIAKDAAKLKGDPRRVLLSFSTDPYQPIDDEYGLTRQVIKILHENDLHVEILTKGGMRALRDFDLLTPRDRVAATLTFADGPMSECWEPHAAPPELRWDMLCDAKSEGIGTWASLEPVIDPAQTLQLIDMTQQCVDLYKVGKWNYDARAKEIDWAKFLRNVTAKLRHYGKEYYIKNDLACYGEVS